MGAEKLAVKPIKSTVKKITRTISQEAEENIGKTLDNIHSRYWFERNANRVNPRNIQAPNKSTFKSIVGDNPSEFVESAIKEGDERRAIVAAHQERMRNMKGPNESPAAILKGNSNPTPDNPDYSAIGNAVEDAEKTAQVEAAVQAKLDANAKAVEDQINAAKSEQLSTKLSESSEEIIGGTTMAKNILPNDSYGLKPGQSLKSNLKIKNVPKDYDKEIINTGVKPVQSETGTETSEMIGSVGRAALGTAVGGAALCAALSSSRGQQNNAQLYGQQPLY